MESGNSLSAQWRMEGKQQKDREKKEKQEIRTSYQFNCSNKETNELLIEIIVVASPRKSYF